MNETNDDFFGKWPLVIPCAVATVMLISATGRHGYDFYTFLRWVVTAASIWAFVVAKNHDKTWAVVAFAAVAVLFNPIIPVHLSRDIWRPIDIIAALLFVAAALTVRPSADVSGRD